MPPATRSAGRRTGRWPCRGHGPASRSGRRRRPGLDRAGQAGRDRIGAGDRVRSVLDRRGAGTSQAELMPGQIRREELAGDRLIAGTQALAEDAPSRCTRRVRWQPCVLRYLAVFMPVPTTIRRVRRWRWCRGGRHKGVGHPESADAEHAQVGVDDRLPVGADPARSPGVGMVLMFRRGAARRIGTGTGVGRRSGGAGCQLPGLWMKLRVRCAALSTVITKHRRSGPRLGNGTFVYLNEIGSM
jgi:hypothetical protein